MSWRRCLRGLCRDTVKKEKLIRLEKKQKEIIIRTLCKGHFKKVRRHQEDDFCIPQESSSLNSTDIGIENICFNFFLPLGVTLIALDFGTL